MLSKGSAPLGFAQLIGAEKYSDLKFVCQEKEFKVHKAIVCTQSPVLAAACDGGFKEGATSCVDVKEFDAGTVERMIEFLYTKDYEPEGQGSEGVSIKNVTISTSSAELNNADEIIFSLLLLTHADPLHSTAPATTNEILVHHVHVNAIVDHNNIPQLKQVASTKIQHILENTWSADGFLSVVKEVFHSTRNTVLREIIASTAAAHIEEPKGFATLHVMSDFAVSIIWNTIKSCKTKEELVTEKLQVVESQLRDIESRLQSAEQDCNYEKSLREWENNEDDCAIKNIEGCSSNPLHSRHLSQCPL